MTGDPDNQRVLGIDPGLNITGYGVLDVTPGGLFLCEAGVVRGGSAKKPIEERLDEIFTSVSEILDTFQPNVVALEQLFSHYARPRTAILMGHARGVICLAAARAGVPVCHYAATQVKKMLTGSGRAPKHQVQLAICHEFNLAEVPEPPDVADALAIALCHAHFDRGPNL